MAIIIVKNKGSNQNPESNNVVWQYSTGSSSGAALASNQEILLDTRHVIHVMTVPQQGDDLRTIVRTDDIAIQAR